jgi:hypothetical protein
LSSATLSIGKPVYTEVRGDNAYMVYPASFTDREKGKAVVYRGVWTMTLRKTSRGWFFTGSAADWGGTYTVSNGP